MSQKSKAAYERYLNNCYNEQFAEDVYDQFFYFTNHNRKPFLSKGRLRKYIADEHVGAMIRRYDPTMFEVGYNEWKKS